MAQLRSGSWAEASAQTAQLVGGMDMIDGVLPSMIADRQRVASMHEGSENWHLVRDVQLQFSNTGPISCFLAAVIPLITEEMPSLPSVARELQRKWGNKRP